MVMRYIRRHRLEKKDPTAAISEPVKPIQYWVDPGAPEDVRKALVEGASWWNQAFEAAGFRNAFKVEVLPDGIDPMDIRYNMINWVHRSTRGWSTGGTVSDPRTGEIIKATVTLGSLRDRQDYLIFEGLLSPYTTGSEKPDVLTRRRWRASANWPRTRSGIRSASATTTTTAPRAGSPSWTIRTRWRSCSDDGSIDLSQAYQARIGDWDKVAINYGYRELPARRRDGGAAKILDDAWEQDLRYMTNQDTGAIRAWTNGRTGSIRRTS